MAVKRAAKKYLPEPVQAVLRSAYLQVGDLVDRLRKPNRLLPPRSLHDVGGGDFERAGQEFRAYFLTLGRLRSTDRVLDIGCGTGRMALPLTTYLTPPGEYLGFDITHEGITWCQQQITPRYPNFHFRFADIHNGTYNPHGRERASTYRFPVADGAMDFAFMTSVCTHLLTDDMENYVAETARALKSGGRCLITFFLLNDETRRLLPGRKDGLRFAHKQGRQYVEDAQHPERAVAQLEESVRELYARNGLIIEEPIRFGKWSGRADGLSYQDIVLATRQ